MKKYLALCVVSLALLILFSLPTAAEQQEDAVIKLKYVMLKDIENIFTPGHKKKRLISAIDLPIGEGRGVKCSVDSNSVEIDTNLDGEPDKRVSANGKIVELTIRDSEESKKRKYAVRITYDARFAEKQWFYESATGMQGNVKGKKILIIDDNCNGKFADYGEDGLIIGKSMAGWYLSSAVDVGKGLVELDIDPDGTNLNYREFIGATGVINPFRKLKKAKFKPMVFVVKQEDRSFNIIREGNKGSSVPIGRYTIERGVIGMYTEFVGGNHPPFEVLKDNTTNVEWGGPYSFLFFKQPGDKFPPAMYGVDDKMHVFVMEPPYVMGEKGEVYVGNDVRCEPERALSSPFGNKQKHFLIAERMDLKVEILNRKTKRPVNHLRFYSGFHPNPDPQPASYYWETFSWTYGELRGTYILRVTCPNSRFFKKAVFEAPIELK